MSTKEPTSTDLINFRQQHMANRHLTELARISAWLFLGVLALMTFLLTVGLQHPQPLFSYFCYSSIIILPLNLLIYAVTNLLASTMTSTMVADDAAAGDKTDDEDDAKPAKAMAKTKSGGAVAWVKALRLVQQLVFILGLVAVTGLGLVSAHIFFAPPAAQVQQGQ